MDVNKLFEKIDERSIISEGVVHLSSKESKYILSCLDLLSGGYSIAYINNRLKRLSRRLGFGEDDINEIREKLARLASGYKAPAQKLESVDKSRGINIAPFTRVKSYKEAQDLFDKLYSDNLEQGLSDLKRLYAVIKNKDAYLAKTWKRVYGTIIAAQYTEAGLIQPSEEDLESGIEVLSNESSNVNTDDDKSWGEPWKNKNGVFVNFYGAKGGGLPGNFPSWIEPIVADFHVAYLEHAAEEQGVEPEDADPLQYSEGSLDDSSGFIVASERKLSDDEVENLTGAILYWFIEKKINHKGKNWFVYAGVAGV